MADAAAVVGCVLYPEGMIVTYHNMGKKERAAPVIDVIERPRDSPVG
jgi:hypothetical protein